MKNKKILDPDKVWFISDTHFGHNSVIEFDNRPFNNIIVHDNIIIDNWNNKVKENDFVFHLGDFSLSSGTYGENILKKLNGKIILIKGNHDRNNILKSKKLQHYFFDIQDLTRIAINDNDEPLKRQSIVLCHYPIDDWEGKVRGSWHFHGHSHIKSKRNNTFMSLKVNEKYEPRFNINVSFINYTPINYMEIKRIYNGDKEII